MANEFSRLLGGAAAPKFDANKKAKQLAGLLSKSEAVTIDGAEYIFPRLGTVPVIMQILEEFRKNKAGE